MEMKMKKRILLFTISLLSACNNQQQQPVEPLQETIRVHNILINVITPQNGVPIDFEKKEFQEAKTFFDKIQQVAKVARAYYIYPEPSCYTRGSGRYSTKECHQGLVEKTCFLVSMELLNPSLTKLSNEQRLSESLKYIEHRKRELKKNAIPIVTFDILDEGENYIVYAKKSRKYAHFKPEVTAKLALNGLLFEGVCTNNSPTAKFTSWESTATVNWVRELIKINQQGSKPDQP
jgi:lipoprotein